MPEKDNRKISADGADKINPAELEGQLNQEYNSVDNALDAINSALDVMEQKNDDIHQKLVELLQSSKSIRQEIQTVMHSQPNNDSKME